jgi:hypothetical protein
VISSREGLKNYILPFPSTLSIREDESCLIFKLQGFFYHQIRWHN